MARPVIFDEAAALRIVNTIRKVETGDRAERPLTFEAVQQPRKIFRIATFSGSWSIGATATVSFASATANTAVAVNLFAAVPAPSGTAHCAIARDGSAWYLIAARCP
jgi:streptogramin lyase